MVHLSQETEALARNLARERGISIDEAVKLALEESAAATRRPTDGRKAPTREELIRRMEEISVRCAARPMVDPRSPDEIIGYDDYGLPR